MRAALLAEFIAPEQWAAYQTPAAGYWALRARQPGFRGAVQVDVGKGRYLALLLWDSVEDFLAARSALLAGHEPLALFWAAPLAVLGYGEVTNDSLTTAPPRGEQSAIGFVNEATIAADQRADTTP